MCKQTNRQGDCERHRRKEGELKREKRTHKRKY